MRNDIIEGMRECGLATLEFPGGCFADVYHWGNGIGPVNQRPGGEWENGMGTDEYMQLCSLINAEPYICANLKTGTPQEMAEWINYVNDNPSHPEWYVKYWSMGNEPWGCGGELSANEFADQYAEFVSAVPENEEKPIVRIAGAGTGNTDWVNAVFDRNPGKVDGFSVHRYLFAGPSIYYSDFEYHEVINLAYGVTSFIRSFDQAMDRYDPENNIGLMYNEWGAWYEEISSQGFTFSQSTVRDAIIAAIHLNAFNNHCERVDLACVAQPVNVIQALFLTDINDQTRMVKTPVFYAFKLFKPHQNARKIPIDLQTESFNQNVEGTNFSYPYLTASASIDSAENVNITISNSDLSNSRYLEIQLDGSTQYGSLTGKIITAPEVTAFNDFGQPEQVNIQMLSDDNFSLEGNSISVEVPSKSVIRLKLTKSEDCAGVEGGEAYIDNCGECVGGTTGNEPCVQDCNGDWGGDAYTDECGVCVAGATGVNPCTGSVQGEDATDFDGVIESTNVGFLGEGYLNYYNEVATSAEWVICSDTTFTSALTIRYSNGSGINRNLALSVNGEEQISSLEIPATSSWTEWDRVAAELDFQEGENLVSMTALSEEGGPNIDIITFSDENLNGCGSGIKSGENALVKTKGIEYTGGRLSFYLQQKSNVDISVYNISGQRVMTLFKQDADRGYNYVQFDTSEFTAGMYILVLKTGNRILKKRVLRVQGQ